ncbi:hypothetical protein ACFL6C_10405 [Myxococcota bacterium]
MDQVLERVDREQLGCRSDLANRTVWPKGQLNLFLRGESTRATETTLHNGTFSVRVFSLACAADWQLATKIVENVGRLAGGVISSDVGECDADNLTTLVPEGWRDRQAASGIKAVAGLIGDGRGPVDIPGPIRSFFVGERMLKNLDAGSEEATIAAWFAAMRRVQWFGESECEHFGGLFEASSPDSNKTFQIAFWIPAEAWGMPAVQYVGVSAKEDDGGVLIIPAEAVEKVAVGQWEWLDEKQRVVYGFDEAAWPALRKQAASFAVQPK